MSEAFEKDLNVFLREDVLMREVPEYAQKEKIRATLARQERELRELVPSAPKAEELAEQLRRAFDSFSTQHKLVAQRFAQQREVSAQSEKEGAKEAKSREVAESLKEKYKQQYAALMTVQVDSDRQFQEELTACQKSLRDQESLVFSLRERKENAEGHSQNLAEHRESFLGEIEKLTRAKEAEIREKKELVAEMQEKIEESLNSLNLDEKEEERVDPELENAQAFQAQFASSCAVVVEEWEKFSSSELEKCLGPINAHIEKIQKLRPGLENSISEFKSKLWGSLNRLAEKAEENASLRAKIVAERKKQAMFEQLKKDLEAKLSA